jgi:hypothetical protein
MFKCYMLLIASISTLTVTGFACSDPILNDHSTFYVFVMEQVRSQLTNRFESSDYSDQ